MATGSSAARSYVALSLLKQEPKAVRGRQAAKGGRNHGLGTNDHGNSNSFLGSPRPSSYLMRATLKTKLHAQERTGNHACRHTLLVSHRNWQLGDAFPDVFFSLQWPRVFVLYGMCPFHSIGVPHQDRSTMFGLWASLSRCNPLRRVAGSFLRRRTFPALLTRSTSLIRELTLTAPRRQKIPQTPKPNTVMESGSLWRGLESVGVG